MGRRLRLSITPHGIELDGRNWLIPRNATLASPVQLNFQAIDLEKVLAAASAAPGLRMVVIDACRNNPFAPNWTRAGALRTGASRGLRPIEAPATLVLYAAQAGQVADDGRGSNSPFAVSLATRLAEPGVDIRLAVSKVRDDVLAATDNRQEPLALGSLPGREFFLVPKRQIAATDAGQAARAELEYWNLCCADQDSPKDNLTGYLKKVEEGAFGGMFAVDAQKRLIVSEWSASDWPSFLTGGYFPNPKFFRHLLKVISPWWAHGVLDWSPDWLIWILILPWLYALLFLWMVELVLLAFGLVLGLFGVRLGGV